MPLFPLKFNTDKDTKLDNAAGTFDTKLLLTSRVVRAGNSICLLACKIFKTNENYLFWHEKTVICFANSTLTINIWKTNCTAEHLCRLSRCFFFGDEMIFELGTRRGISVRRLLATRNVRNDSNLVCCLWEQASMNVSHNVSPAGATLNERWLRTADFERDPKTLNLRQRK